MFDFLHRMGGKTGLITASEFFLYSAKDRKCIDVCRARGYRFPRVTAWIRANKDDLKLARDMEFDETGMELRMEFRKAEFSEDGEVAIHAIEIDD